MESLAEQIRAEVADAPAELQREVLDFARFLRQRAQQVTPEQGTHQPSEHLHALALAASAWTADWSDADEEAAWANL